MTPFMSDPNASATLIGIILGFVCIMFLVGLAISIIVCLLLFKCYQRVPREFRKQEPGLVWLLLIPCFNLVWNFFVYPRLSDSLRDYFASVGQTDTGDCARSIGLAYSICMACSIIPYVGALPLLAALVLQIIYLIKVWELKNRIPEQAQIPFQPPPQQGQPRV